ncbi:MAG: DUF1501 domain-containing protein [Fuerstiella sp.]|jgi:hypothetical protein|nr:DUF1501 domain-containing protein [Fuerstiella sp.]MDG2127546.1 DUF1501 domain-containing protein [Fuerstiella sp.]
MLSLINHEVRLCDGLSRREVMRVGGLGLGGLSLANLPGARAEGYQQPPVRARNVILFWLTGGVPQHDTWDPKPDGPDSSRSEFGAIPSATPGLHVGGLMPMTSRLTNRIAVVRSMYSGDHSHSSSGYQMLTGIPHAPLSRENATPQPPNDWPSLGALVRTQRADRNGLPSAITLPRRIANVGEIVWPGQDAGFLGRKLDPWLLTCDPSANDFAVPDLALPEQVSQVRLERRISLLNQVNAGLDTLESHVASRSYGHRVDQAVNLLVGSKTRQAFDLSQESDSVKDRYGRSKFAQSVLLSRRLVEAGVSLVQVNWQQIEGKTNNGSWDTHARHHDSLKGWLMPIMDRSFSALLEDLDERGLLDETLVAWVGEFGHTPKINANGGRDHWGHAFSIAMAGGGIKGGVVLGETDSQAGHVIRDRVLPRDYVATVLHCMGLSPETSIHDVQGRPLPISRGKVIREILA